VEQLLVSSPVHGVAGYRISHLSEVAAMRRLQFCGLRVCQSERNQRNLLYQRHFWKLHSDLK